MVAVGVAVGVAVVVAVGVAVVVAVGVGVVVAVGVAVVVAMTNALLALALFCSDYTPEPFFPDIRTTAGHSVEAAR